MRVRYCDCRSPQQQQTLKFAPSVAHSVRLGQTVAVGVELSVHELCIVVNEYVVAALVRADGSEQRVAALHAGAGVRCSSFSCV